MTTVELIEHLGTEPAPLRVLRGGTVLWSDEDRHTAAFTADPGGYALLALVPGTPAGQRARILLCLLQASWAGFDPATRQTLARVARVLTLGLDAALVATVLLALRHRRANHKHVTRAAVRLLVEHPDGGRLASTHRAVLVSIVEHALGRSTARGVAGALTGTGTGGDVDVRRALLRFAAEPGTAIDRMRALYAPPAPPVVAPAGVGPIDLDLDGERPAAVTVTNRGDLAATFVHRLRGGTGSDLDAAVERYRAAAAATVPAFPGHLALVLDRSPSMRGYGDREFAVLSQAYALRAVLERRCARLSVVPVEGPGTDLATGVLDALGTGPDLVAVVSDGYENVYPGDLAAVCAALPGIGVDTPVVFCHSMFSHSDDLARRRPAPGLPQRAFWHEADFAGLVVWLLTHVRHADAHRWLTDALRGRLAAVERTAPGNDRPEGADRPEGTVQ